MNIIQKRTKISENFLNDLVVEKTKDFVVISYTDFLLLWIYEKENPHQSSK